MVTTMLAKLKSRNSFHEIMRKTTTMLAAMDLLGICIFDHSQMICLLKFQQGEKSSKYALTTSRLFLDMMIPTLISLITWPKEWVPLTRINQCIPSPPGMPMYESINGITPAVFYGLMVCSTAMDVSDNRVSSWASLAMLASQIYKVQCLLKSNENEAFQFQYEDNIMNMRGLKVNLKLKKNRNGFYQTVKTIKWQGQPTKAHVIIPLLSLNDETIKPVQSKLFYHYL